MSEFTNVTVIREANIYFDGAVASRTVVFADGSRKTLGIMHAGEYTFNTGAAEVMEILAGKLEFSISGSGEWIAVGPGESFHVPAHSSFTMRVEELTDYCCSFLG